MLVIKYMRNGKLIWCMCAHTYLLTGVTYRWWLSGVCYYRSWPTLGTIKSGELRVCCSRSGPSCFRISYWTTYWKWLKKTQVNNTRPAITPDIDSDMNSSLKILHGFLICVYRCIVMAQELRGVKERWKNPKHIDNSGASVDVSASGPCYIQMGRRAVAGEWKIKAFSGRRVCCIYTRPLRPTTTHRKLVEGRRTDETSGRRCSRQAHINNLTTHTLHLVSYTLPFPTAREHPPFFCHLCITIICGAAAELHGRDTRDEQRRAGGSLLSAAEGNPGRWILPRGLGVVRLGLQDDGQSWPARLHSGKANENHSDFYILVMYFIEWAWQIGCGSRLLFYFVFWKLFLAIKNRSAMRGDVNRHFVLFYYLLDCKRGRLRPAGREAELRAHSPHVSVHASWSAVVVRPLTIIPGWQQLTRASDRKVPATLSPLLGGNCCRRESCMQQLVGSGA